MNVKAFLKFVIGPVCAGALGFLTIPILASFYSAEDLGRLNLLQVTVSLAVLCSSLGLHQSYVREYNESKNKASLLKNMVAPGFLVLITISLIISFNLPLVSQVLFDVESSTLTILFIAATFGSYFIHVFSHVVRMKEWGGVFSISQALPKVFFLVISLLNIYLANRIVGVAILFSSFVYSILLTLLIVSIFLKKDIVCSFRSELDFSELIEMLKFGLPLVFGSIAYWGMSAIDRYFLKFYSTYAEIGIYAVTVSFATSAKIVSNIFSNIWHPTVYKWVSKGCEVGKIQKVAETMVIIVAGIWTAAGSLSWLLTYYLPGEYYPVNYLLVACIASPLLYMLSETTVVGIGIAKKSFYSLLSSVSAFLTNLIFNYVLIPEYGAMGAALATLVSFGVFFTVRTEASCYLWEKFSRSKLYIIVTLYSVFSVYFVINSGDVKYGRLCWIGLFLMTLLMNYKLVFEYIVLFKEKLVIRNVNNI